MARDYSEKLKDPRWQKKRLEILERDKWQCTLCTETRKTLVVHHRKYISNTEPWDYPNDLLVTLCEDCHESERQKRPAVETELLDALRILFMSDDLNRIVNGFKNLQILDANHSVYIEWALQDPSIQQELSKRYWEMILQEMEEMEEMKKHG